MTIVKDDALNYDCGVWFLKERRKKNAQQSQIASCFFFVFFLNIHYRE